MAEHEKVHDDGPSSFVRFLHQTVGPLSRAFAESPLMQLRVKTPHGRVTLCKTAATVASQTPVVAAETSEAHKGPHARGVPRIYNGEAGRSYDTINAEVVGIFRDMAEPPATGDRLDAGRVLGHIEALRLRNEVRCPIECTLIAQVVVDGQPVDFGEPLFVVDSGGQPLASAVQATEPADIAEPPRM